MSLHEELSLNIVQVDFFSELTEQSMVLMAMLSHSSMIMLLLFIPADSQLVLHTPQSHQ